MRFGKFLSMSALLGAAAVFLSVANAQTLTNVTPLVNGCRGTAGTGTCSVCQGWCTLDSDCAGHLRCFHRNLLTPVPGCTCTSGDCGAVGKWIYSVAMSHERWRFLVICLICALPPTSSPSTKYFTLCRLGLLLRPRSLLRHRKLESAVDCTKQFKLESAMEQRQLVSASELEPLRD